MSEKKQHPRLASVKATMIHNLPSKILAVVLAILLWCYVVSRDDSITRSRTVSGLTCVLNSKTVLQSNSLALSSNPLESLGSVSVQLDVSQANMYLVNENNVSVYLDLSQIRSAGTQLVPLKATSAYGNVQQIYPASVEVTVEPIDSRSVPLNTSITGKNEPALWYNVKSLNPQTITVSGASSIVQNISRAVVTIDAEDLTESSINTYSYVLYNYDGEVVDTSLLTRSSSSVTASIDIYPTKELPVSTEPSTVLQASLKSGYEVKSITISPSSITVAADQSLLDSLSEIVVTPIEFKGDLDRSFTLRTTLQTLSGIQYISAEEVYVTVEIDETEDTAVFTEIMVTPVNLPDGLSLESYPDTVTVRITGPQSEVASVTDEMFYAIVDLSGAKAGTASYPVQVSAAGTSRLTYEVTPGTCTLTVQNASEP